MSTVALYALQHTLVPSLHRYPIVRYVSIKRNLPSCLLQAKKGRLIGEDSDDESSALAAAKTEKAKKQKALKIKVDGASKAMKDAGAKKIVYDDDGEHPILCLIFIIDGMSERERHRERERESCILIFILSSLVSTSPLILISIPFLFLYRVGNVVEGVRMVSSKLSLDSSGRLIGIL